MYIVYLLEFIGGDCTSAASDLYIQSPVRSLAHALNNGNRVIGVFRPPDVFSRLDFHVSTIRAVSATGVTAVPTI